METYSLESYTSRHGMTSKTIEKFKVIAEKTCPDLLGLVVEDYTLIGKFNRGKNLYLFNKQNDEGTDDLWSALLRDSTSKPAKSGTGKVKNNTAGLDPMNLDIIKLGDIDYDPKLFIPIKSNTPLDYVFSKKGGTMPATNYILIGDPGIGKSTLSIEYAAQLQANNPDKKILFICGEMTRIDMAEYLERFEEWKELNTVFVSEFTEGRYKETIEHWFNEGWDFIVGDSFAEIVDAIKEDQNTYHGKMSSTGAEKWLIDLMVDNNLAKNKKKLNTAHLLIQQVTKGGKFVGSNKLKHNTTGMIELRYTKTSERTIIVDKNRRGWKYQNLHFKFNEDTSLSPVEYDVERVEREIAQHNKINAERDQLLLEEELMKGMFNNSEEQVINRTEDDMELETDEDLTDEAELITDEEVEIIE